MEKQPARTKPNPLDTKKNGQRGLERRKLSTTGLGESGRYLEAAWGRLSVERGRKKGRRELG